MRTHSPCRSHRMLALALAGALALCVGACTTVEPCPDARWQGPAPGAAAAPGSHGNGRSADRSGDRLLCACVPPAPMA
ncbi:hypothetical protein ACPOLB_25220 [Rubrivivax sp. RP6-9]|uniref:hypothetical protein n=1 Tax=Rubrivivax sp. RP6-9 TaxID=3415750 RepID=UPI003CC56FCB